MAECKTCKYAVQSPQIMYFYCMNNERNKHADREERYKRTQGIDCPYCTQKERGADKQKITCLNCKHLMFSDMYGECNKQLKIVNPSDTCEYAEQKERGGEK